MALAFTRERYGSRLPPYQHTLYADPFLASTYHTSFVVRNNISTYKRG